MALPRPESVARVNSAVMGRDDDAVEHVVHDAVHVLQTTVI
jgi:hypothetical protein